MNLPGGSCSTKLIRCPQPPTHTHNPLIILLLIMIIINILLLLILIILITPKPRAIYTILFLASSTHILININLPFMVMVKVSWFIMIIISSLLIYSDTRECEQVSLGFPSVIFVIFGRASMLSAHYGHYHHRHHHHHIHNLCYIWSLQWIIFATHFTQILQRFTLSHQSNIKSAFY